MTEKDRIAFRDNAVKILEDNTQYATANAVKMAFNALGCVEQYRWERDVALEMLGELGLSFGERTDSVYLYEKMLKADNIYIVSSIDNKGTHVGRFKKCSLDADGNLIIETDIDSVSCT